MEKFDVLVIGSGSGMAIASAAVASRLKTAIVEKGPMGGTCLNRGCVPSKMLIYPADVVQILSDSQQVGVNATLRSVDFKKIMERMHRLVSEDSGSQAASVKVTPGLTWFAEQGEFISDYTMQIGKHVIQATRIFIVSGARPRIPNFKGLEKVDYLTSDSCSRTGEPPKKHHNRRRRLHRNRVRPLLLRHRSKLNNNPETAETNSRRRTRGQRSA